MLTERQELFAKYIAIYNYSVIDATREAGYANKGNAYLSTTGMRLLRTDEVSARIDELREGCFDPETVRKAMILELWKAMDNDITDVVFPVEYIDDLGVVKTRLKVRPISEWSRLARSLCTGYDRNGIPTFLNKLDAMKETCRIFGLYKDNQVKVEQDTSGILESAGLTPTYKESSKTSSLSETSEDLFNGYDLDKLLDEEAEMLDQLRDHHGIDESDFDDEEDEYKDIEEE